MKISVNVDIDQVELRAINGTSVNLRGQWVEFYALLCLIEQESLGGDQFLSARELHRVGHWAKGSEASVGKEVARHLKELKNSGLAQAFMPLTKTQKWRLTLSPEQIVLYPDRETIKHWLTTRGWQGLPSEPSNLDLGTIDWITATTRALFSLQAGHIEQSMSLASLAGTSTENPFLKCISDLVLLRGLVRSGAATSEIEEIEQIHSQIHSVKRGFLSESIRARADATKALAASNYESEDGLSQLSKLAARMYKYNDSGTLGLIYSIMGVLAKRKNALELAEQHLLKAIPLLALSDDLPGLQGALCNLAQVLYLRQKQSSSSALIGAIEALYDTEYSIVKEYGYGKDTGQAEITAASFALKKGDLTRAHKFLDLAEQICSKSERDQAPLAWNKARYILAKAAQVDGVPIADAEEALCYMRTAQDLYGVAGEVIPDLDTEIKTLESALARYRRTTRAVPPSF